MGRDDFMVIEVLYVPGCLHHQPAMDILRNVLRVEAVNAPIQQIAVTDETTARLLHFPGSPTVRVNGQDVEPDREDSYGLACRLYSDGSGLPSLEALKRAIAGAIIKEVEI